MPPTETQLESTRAAFAENFASRGELGAALCVWSGGEKVLSLIAGNRDNEGTPWSADTLVPVWSATKGPAAACVLTAMHEAGLTPQSKVVEVWPGFGGAGKETITLAHLLSHQAGLPALDRSADVAYHPGVLAAIEEQAPHWEPGTAHGYHPRTMGTIFEELLRRLTDARDLGTFWRERIAEPLGLDFWIGLPPDEHHRVATLQPGRMSPGAGSTPFMKAFGDPESFTRKAFSSPKGLASVTEMNKAEAWSMGSPGFGGVGSARALAKFYAALAAGGELDGVRIVPREVVDWMSEARCDGADRVLIEPTSFALGTMCDPLDGSGRKLRSLFGSSTRAFGHPGAGGSLAFADPENGTAFAYVMNQMGLGALPGNRATALVDALYAG